MKNNRTWRGAEKQWWYGENQHSLNDRHKKKMLIGHKLENGKGEWLLRTRMRKVFRIVVRVSQ